MRILDKLKPQPRWKNADPSVRLEALRELTDQVELATLAETDPDARVRRAAVGLVDDVAVLGRIVASDSDDEARDRASDRLLGLAGSPDEATALAAVGVIADGRRLATLAKGDAPEAVRAAALAKVTDERALGAIARHAKHASTSQAAAERVSSADALVEVALNSDHKDVAMAAFERAVPEGAGAESLELLQSIEARTQQKAVARRARTMIQSIEQAAAAARAAEEERRRREAACCEDAERVSEIADVAAANAELARVETQWAALASSDAAATERFTAAVVAARAAIARREAEAEAAAEYARQRAEAIATRDALCQRVETLDGDDVLEQLIPIEEEWRSLMPLIGNGPEADRLDERFALAVAACRKRHEMGAQLAAARETLATLVAEAESLPSLTDHSAALERWLALSREARGLAATLAGASRPATDLAARWAVVEEAFAARAAATREAELKVHHDVAAQLVRLIERSRRVAEAETITLREGERLMRDIKAGLDSGAKVESTRELEDAMAALRSLQEKVAPRVRELRELDDWRRFANAQRQEQLIAMAEAIVAALKSDVETGKDSDLAGTATALRELHAKWQEVAEAPRHSAQRLWERFRTATDFMRTRCEVYFAKMRDERTTNLKQKAALVEEAETLAQTSDWGRAAKRFQEMQTEWQATGPVPREAGRELGQRFRTACNTFFARRREDLTDRKKVWTDNLARKEQLCERAEALAESTEWDSAASEMKRLQADWKTIGPVRRNKSELVWARFRAAADRFFERYHNRHVIAIQGKLAEREALVVDLEALVAEAEAPADLSERLQTLRSAWTKGVPIPAAEMRALADRWQAAFSQLGAKWPATFKGTEFDPDLVRQKLEKIVSRVEGLLEQIPEASAKGAGTSQTELLAARLRSAFASNAMGGRSGDESKWRAAAEAVRDAQVAWQRLAPMAGDTAQALDARFREACRKVNDHARRHAGPPPRRSPRTNAAAAV